MSNIIPLQPVDAKTAADRETEIKRKIFEWCDALLKKLGLTKKIKAATSITELDRIKLNLNDVDVTLAVNTALHPKDPANPNQRGKRAEHFQNLSDGALKHILKVCFEEAKHYRELELQRGSTASDEEYNSAVCLPDVILAVIHEYFEMGEHEAVATVLWALHASVFNYFMISPRLVLKSALPGAGKSNLLDVLALLTPRGRRVDNISAAALFRRIDREPGATICFDEAQNDQIAGVMREIMNSGYRRNGVVERCIDGVDREFKVFGPMAIAVNGTLKDDLLSRSVVNKMQQARRTDLRRFYLDDPYIVDVVKPLGRQMAAWARSRPQLNLNPDLPKTLRNRVGDNWLVFISVADAFGAEWGKKARDAAEVFLRTANDDNPKLAILIYAKRVFREALKTDRCSNEAFTEALHGFHEGPWNEFTGLNGNLVPHKIRTVEVTKLLNDNYGIHPGTVWPKGRKRGNKSQSYAGYMEAWFEDAWARHLPDNDE